MYLFSISIEFLSNLSYKTLKIQFKDPFSFLKKKKKKKKKASNIIMRRKDQENSKLRNIGKWSRGVGRGHSSRRIHSGEMIDNAVYLFYI